MAAGRETVTRARQYSLFFCVEIWSAGVVVVFLTVVTLLTSFLPVSITRRALVMFR